MEPLNVSRETFPDLEAFRKIIIERNKEVNLISRESEKISKGLDEISPSDTSELYKINVMNRLKRDHETKWKVNGIEVPPLQ